MKDGAALRTALGSLDREAIARDVAALVQVPSLTGDEWADLGRVLSGDGPGRGGAA